MLVARQRAAPARAPRPRRLNLVSLRRPAGLVARKPPPAAPGVEVLTTSAPPPLRRGCTAGALPALVLPTRAGGLRPAPPLESLRRGRPPSFSDPAVFERRFGAARVALSRGDAAGRLRPKRAPDGSAPTARAPPCPFPPRRRSPPPGPPAPPALSGRPRGRRRRPMNQFQRPSPVIPRNSSETSLDLPRLAAGCLPSGPSLVVPRDFGPRATRPAPRIAPVTAGGAEVDRASTAKSRVPREQRGPRARERGRVTSWRTPTPRALDGGPRGPPLAAASHGTATRSVAPAAAQTPYGKASSAPPNARAPCGRPPALFPAPPNPSGASFAPAPAGLRADPLAPPTPPATSASGHRPAALARPHRDTLRRLGPFDPPTFLRYKSERTLDPLPRPPARRSASRTALAPRTLRTNPAPSQRRPRRSTGDGRAPRSNSTRAARRRM